MCGIAGIAGTPGPPPLEALIRMIRQLHHRGPDDTGIYRDSHAGLACARLAIVDLVGGNQPIPNEDQTVWVICNGEIYNSSDLSQFLISRGHVLRSRSDVEVIVHLYEEYGDRLFEHLNGEFAVAIWDVRRIRLLLGRDRLGIRPIFFTICNGAILFSSEVKALAAYSAMTPSIDLQGLDQFLTFWTTVGKRSIFSGVSHVPPGHRLSFERGHVTIERYWQLPVTSQSEILEDCAEELFTRLMESVRTRLRAEVPTGVYVSGGIDSAAIAYFAQQFSAEPIKTFSLSFDDEKFDESIFQREVTQALGTDHTELHVSARSIGDALPDVIWHTEMPMVRTAAAALYLLSRAVRDAGVKAVLSGEGADEIFLGYDLYKAVVFNKLAAAGESLPNDATLLRHVLSADPYMMNEKDDASLSGLLATVSAVQRQTDSFYGVHRFRWDRVASIKQYLSQDVRNELAGYDALADLRSLLPLEFSSMDALHRAQYLDIQTLLIGYSLSSQGDRVSMAHSVESRVPFLDHTLVEFAARIPAGNKLVKFVDKAPLREALRSRLPTGIVTRQKRAYGAPNWAALFHPREQPYVADLTSSSQIAGAGLFDSKKVRELVKLCRNDPTGSRGDVLALISILTTQMLFSSFRNVDWHAHCSARYRLVDYSVSR
jgi:asparagine synthase (glutamine-hydrolysing)